MKCDDSGEMGGFLYLPSHSAERPMPAWSIMHISSPAWHAQTHKHTHTRPRPISLSLTQTWTNSDTHALASSHSLSLSLSHSHARACGQKKNSEPANLWSAFSPFSVKCAPVLVLSFFPSLRPNLDIHQVAKTSLLGRFFLLLKQWPFEISFVRSTLVCKIDILLGLVCCLLVLTQLLKTDLILLRPFCGNFFVFVISDLLRPIQGSAPAEIQLSWASG